jgi:hypothetical protein
MELELVRVYFPNGCNGELYYNGERICFTIELPWLDNKSRISCIPEGRYALTKRYSPRFKHHLQLLNVDKRSLILIHAANDAQKELKGCIAPVSILTAEGKGSQSRKALEKLLKLVVPELDKDNQVFLTIKSDMNEAE